MGDAARHSLHVKKRNIKSTNAHNREPFFVLPTSLLDLDAVAFYAGSICCSKAFGWVDPFQTGKGIAKS